MQSYIFNVKVCLCSKDTRLDFSMCFIFTHFLALNVIARQKNNLVIWKRPKDENVACSTNDFTGESQFDIRIHVFRNVILFEFNFEAQTILRKWTPLKLLTPNLKTAWELFCFCLYFQWKRVFVWPWP